MKFMPPKTNEERPAAQRRTGFSQVLAACWRRVCHLSCWALAALVMSLYTDSGQAIGRYRCHEVLRDPIAFTSRDHGLLGIESMGEAMNYLVNHGELTAQVSTELQQRELIVPNGGLCATTCGVNLLQGALLYSGVETSTFRGEANLMIHKLVQTVWDQSATDGRLGLATQRLEKALKTLAKPFSDLFKLSTSMEVYIPHWSGLSLKPDEIKVLIIKLARNENRHAILAYAIDGDLYPEWWSVHYSDPNSPNLDREILVNKKDLRVLQDQRPAGHLELGLSVRVIKKDFSKLSLLERIKNLLVKDLRD